MNGNDINRGSATFQMSDIRVAFALLTRFPLPYPPLNANRPAASAAWAYPIVGIAVAFLTIFAIWVAMALGLPPSFAALIGLLSAMLATGAMHEDGLADCADGFWGGWTRERRLEIMKDSQIGTYGVLALGVSLLLRWQAFVLLIDAGALITLVPAAVLSRSAMVWIMYHLPNARAVGLSHQTGKPVKNVMLAAIALGIVIAVITNGMPVIAAFMVATLCTIGLSKLARAKIGGQTGDVLGGTQQIVEIAMILTITAAVHNT